MKCSISETAAKGVDKDGAEFTAFDIEVTETDGPCPRSLTSLSRPLSHAAAPPEGSARVRGVPAAVGPHIVLAAGRAAPPECAPPSPARAEMLTRLLSCLQAARGTSAIGLVSSSNCGKS